MGRSDQDDYAHYQEVLNRAVWSPREAARILLMLLLRHLDHGDGHLIFGVRSMPIEKPWNGVGVPGSGLEASTETRCVPVATNWSRPAGCAGYP